MRFATKAIHCGSEPDPATGAIMPPIYMTSTYIQEAPGISKSGYEYTRASNPNFTILEKQLAALEGAEHATVFSSGLGALTGLVSSLSAGDKVIAIDGLYGGTYRLFNQVFNRFGVGFESYNPHTPEGLQDLEQALRLHPKWLFFETPTNPLMDIFDIEALVKLAQRYQVAAIVDNTFATPYSQNPLKWGADVVWHSSTKYLGGHSDVVGGVVISNEISIKKGMDFARKALGLNPSPFDTWLITRGVKTLPLRMECHSRNAFAIARHLQKHPKVKKVYYPGLESHPGHLIAKKQMASFGGMLSVEFHLSPEKTQKLISSFSLFALAESLGGVESLVCHPATMTHASIPPHEQTKMGLSDSLVRFSVGIEDIVDLINDLDASLELIN
jgi:cystathionine beta-lyase/cystathionine gamma-synthase